MSRRKITSFPNCELVTRMVTRELITSFQLLESFLRVAFVQTCVYLALVHVNFVSHAAKCDFSP